MTEVETERLRFRQWRADDFEDYAKYYADENLARFVGGQMDRNKAWRYLASVVGHWSLRGYGIWAVEEKETGAFVGGIGLWNPEGWPEPEVGYWLMPEMMGKGYATEAVVRSREYAYDVLGMETLVSYIHPDNEPSKRVAERAGAHLEEVIELLEHGPHCVYRHPPNVKVTANPAPTP